MISFQQYLRENFLEPEKIGAGKVAAKTGMELTADYAANAIDTVTVASGGVPLANVAKAILSAIASKVNVGIQNWQKSSALKEARQMVRQKIQQDINSGNASSKALRPGRIEAEVNIYTDATQSSKACLTAEENQVVINKIIEAVKNKTIFPFFAQNLVDEILKEKISTMQKALEASPNSYRNTG